MPARITPVGALGARAAAQYLGKHDARFMDGLPIPKADLRRHGASRPTWVWRIADLDAFLAARLVQPGRRPPLDDPD